MMTAWIRTAHALAPHPVTDGTLPADTVWLDVVNVTKGEETLIESRFGIEVPTRDEMHAIEVSNRLYREGPAAYMTATSLVDTDSARPRTTPVTFVFMRDCLITLRYAEPWAFKAIAQRVVRPVTGCTTAESTFVELMEVTIERLAELIERVAERLEECSHRAFSDLAHMPDLRQVLNGLGRTGSLLGQLHQSLADKERLIGFADQACKEWLTSDAHDRLHVQMGDLRALIAEIDFLANKATFLLDAAVGLISIEQNTTFKVLSVLSVALLPPAVVAGAFGMNFEYIPLTHWGPGFFVALGAMALSGVLPLLVLKRKKWL